MIWHLLNRLIIKINGPTRRPFIFSSSSFKSLLLSSYMANGLLLNSATSSLLLLNRMSSLGLLLLHLNPMPPRVLVLLNHSPWPRSSNAVPLSLYLFGTDQEDIRREAKVVVEISHRPEESLAKAGGIEESWWWLDPVGEGHRRPDPVGEGRQLPDSIGEDREGGLFRVDRRGAGARRDVEAASEMGSKGGRRRWRNGRRRGRRRRRRKDEEDDIRFARSTAPTR